MAIPHRDQLTERARKVLNLADQEARRLNHHCVGTEHVLTAFVSEGTGLAAHALNHFDVDLKKVRWAVEDTNPPGDIVVPETDALVYTPRVKKVIEYAIEAACNFGHKYAGTEHLLLGLLRLCDEHGDPEPTTAEVLRKLQLRIQDVREEVLEYLGHSQARDSQSADMGERRALVDLTGKDLIECLGLVEQIWQLAGTDTPQAALQRALAMLKEGEDSAK